ncbi:hypothetical protein B0E45_25325 [Sinorhizobium sp. A49]|uniref:hypothetical protein n=1 Tax=Sinorhizobium sp. A49 TaxID=1945861 RepID=UPI00098628A3|nr:hypothetical protein [Sinorhizobium sp. A49]OOG66576.1 hypothetical protein B0E45_25325 [Sinorhizobium sp. A49]
MFRANSFLIFLLSSAPLAAAADIDGPLVGTDDYYEAPVEQASLGVTGYIEGAYGSVIDSPGDIDADAWALRGAVNFDAGGGFNLQTDLGYTSASIENANTNNYSGTLHGYYRDNVYAVGAFVQAARLDAGFDSHINDYMGGIEGAYFQDTWTIHGAAGYGQARWEGFDADHYMAALGARFYATDNVRFDLDGALDRITASDIDYDISSLKLTANYRSVYFPVTVFGGYKYANEEVSGFGSSVSGDTGTIFGGLRFSYGSNSLKEEERLGPVWSNNSRSF